MEDTNSSFGYMEINEENIAAVWELMKKIYGT